MLKNKPILAIDVDGVIFNFAKAFAAWWNTNYMIDECWICPENPNSWNFDHPDPKKIGLAIAEFQLTHPHLPLMDSKIPEIMKKLRTRYTIYLVTAYPEELHEIRVWDLEQAGITYDNIIFAPDKIRILQEIGATAFVEDKPDTLLSADTVDIQTYAPGYWNYVQLYKYHNQTNTMLYNDWEELLLFLIRK